MGCPCSKFLLLAEMEQQHHPQQVHNQHVVNHHQHHPQEASIHLDAVFQCKQRKDLVKHARDARLAFSSAQASYLASLVNVGVALEDFFMQHHKGQPLRRRMAIQYTPMSSTRIVISQPSSSSCVDTLEGCNCDGVILLPPPPPPGIHTVEPNIYNAPGEPIFLKDDYHQKSFNHEEEQLEDVPEEDMVLEIEGDEVKVKETMVTNKAEHLVAPSVHQDVQDTTVDSKVTTKEFHHDEEKLAIVMVPTSASEILRAIQEDFHRAAESGYAVAHMLKAGSGLNKATELGLLGAAPSRLKASASSDDLTIETDALGDEVHVAWSHAITLERLCAWELKLYEEVKAVDAINAEFKKKRKLLSKLDTYKEVDETIEYTRAEIKATDMQRSVAMQAMEATSAAIQKIINQELHFQLVELLEGLTDMWRHMHDCHERQRSIVQGLRFPDDNMEPANINRRNATDKLEIAMVSWQGSLKALLNTEEDYIRSLTAWLSASIPRANQKQHISRRQARNIQLAIPEIYFLCQEWEKSLETLPKEHVCGSIRNFAETVSRIKCHQTEELKVEKRLDGLAKELNRKANSVCNMEKKLMEGRKRDSSGLVLSEKKMAVDCTKKLVDEEQTRLRDVSQVSIKFTSSNIPPGLLRLFHGLADFCSICMEAHRELHIRAKHGIKLI